MVKFGEPGKTPVRSKFSRMSMLKLTNLSVSVGEKKIIKNFSFEFKKGKVYVVMGPNGSGKSTLAYALMAHPAYEVHKVVKSVRSVKSIKSKVTKPIISLNGEDITDLDAQKRAEKGIFLSFQTPLSLSGITVFQLLQLALSGKIDPVTLRRKVLSTSKELRLSEELLRRSLNENASGGEKKKLEVLQAAVLDKPIQIFDEVDTGVDVDALKTIGKFLQKNKKNKTYIVITHYNRILKYLKPDSVLILNDGKLVKTGTAKLAELIEKKGYTV